MLLGRGNNFRLTSSETSLGVVISTSITGCGGFSRRRRRVFPAREVPVSPSPSGESSPVKMNSESVSSSLTSSFTSSSASDSLSSLSLSAP